MYVSTLWFVFCFISIVQRCAEGVQGCVVLTCLINSQRNGYRGQISITGYIDDNYYQVGIVSCVGQNDCKILAC